MDASVFYCPGCGQPVDVDFKTRKGVCAWCGNIVTFPRRTFNSDDKVKNELTFSTRYFREKRFEDAKHHAENVLSVAIDNAPALFIRAYYEAFLATNKDSDRIRSFFNELKDIDVDVEEIQPLSELFLLSVRKLGPQEKEVLGWAKSNLPRDDLLRFTDEFCPIAINGRESIDFFDPDLIELYKQIAAECSIPKTCYALLSAIDKNPDSPYPENRFFLKTKTRRFYTDFILPVGEIIKSMDSQELRDKFYRVYQNKQEAFENKMNGGTN